MTDSQDRLHSMTAVPVPTSSQRVSQPQKVTKPPLLVSLQVSHVQADPEQRAQLAGLPLSRFRAAVVLADERWIDPDLDDSHGIDSP